LKNLLHQITGKKILIQFFSPLLAKQLTAGLSSQFVWAMLLEFVIEPNQGELSFGKEAKEP
jgi:hypothetical protein